MSTAEEFLGEINEVFGFFFDVGMACSFALTTLQELQTRVGNSDDSPFMFKDGPPELTPEQELRLSLHDSTLGAVKTRLSATGSDTRKAGETAIVFVFHIWEEKYRGKLVGANGQPKLKSDIVGDLRLLRNSIIHNKGIARNDVAKCKLITRFKPGAPIIVSKQDIYQIIRAIREDFSD